MKLIFECETELGQCDGDRVNGHFGDHTGDWVAFASTTAAATGAKGMLRIEQRCYLRSKQSPDDIRNQSWVKPEMNLEPLLGAKDETLETVQRLHDQYVDKARKEFIEQMIVPLPSFGPAESNSVGSVLPSQSLGMRDSF